MSYWDTTDRHLRSHGPPKCSSCGEQMFPADEHARFMCFCGGGGLDVVTGLSTTPRPIAQVDTAGMDDAAKAQVPPMQRLDGVPTAAEADWFQAAFADLQGDPDADAKFAEADEALKRERGE